MFFEGNIINLVDPTATVAASETLEESIFFHTRIFPYLKGKGVSWEHWLKK